jgi:TPR repeat protein
MSRNILRAGFAAVVLSLDVAAPVTAGPFEDGIAAYRRGDYPTAMGLLRPLADQGNALAQHNLGFMYLNGHGVAQDYVAGAISSHNGKRGI